MDRAFKVFLLERVKVFSRKSGAPFYAGALFIWFAQSQANRTTGKIMLVIVDMAASITFELWHMDPPLICC
ncbi:MAG: hypothetical protein WCV92_05445 [Candidatus Buchananbacteria bacterium]